MSGRSEESYTTDGMVLIVGNQPWFLEPKGSKKAGAC